MIWTVPMPCCRRSQADTLIADKAFDADERVLEPLAEAGKTPVIPPKRNRKSPRPYDKDLYKARHLIENFFSKLKQFRAIATRYDKTRVNFLAAIHLAASSHLAQLRTGPSGAKRWLGQGALGLRAEIPVRSIRRARDAPARRARLAVRIGHEDRQLVTPAIAALLGLAALRLDEQDHFGGGRVAVARPLHRQLDVTVMVPVLGEVSGFRASACGRSPGPP